jgi:hypothetical protein
MPRIRLIHADVSNQMQVACTGLSPVWTCVRDVRHWQRRIMAFQPFPVFQTLK